MDTAGWLGIPTSPLKISRRNGQSSLLEPIVVSSEPFHICCCHPGPSTRAIRVRLALELSPIFSAATMDRESNHLNETAGDNGTVQTTRESEWIARQPRARAMSINIGRRLRKSTKT